MEKKNKVINRFTILGIFLIILLSFAISPVTMQNDTYYTIKIGEHILNNGIDMQDPFSWHVNLPYTYPHWLYDVMIFGIYSIAGFAGIYVSTVMFASILGILLFLVNKKLCKNQVISLIMSLITMYLARDFIAARAQLVTFILFVLAILFIENFIEKRKIRYVIFLLLIPILIANLHCAVWPFYFILFLPYITEWIINVVCKKDIFTKCIYYIFCGLVKIFPNIEKLKEKQNKYIEKIEKNKVSLKKRREHPYRIKIENTKGEKWLIIILVIAILTGLCTPLFDVPYTYLVKTMKGNTTQNISEHLPITLINNKQVLISFAMYLGILIFTDTKIKLRDLFMLTGLTLLTLMSRRQASLFYIIGNFVFAKLASDMAEKYAKNTFLKIEKFMKGIIGQTLVVLILICVSALIVKPKLDDKFVDENSYPVKACDYILENFDFTNVKLYNEYNYGSYLIYRNIPVFIDSRADLYSPEFNGEKNNEGKLEGRDIFTDFLDISSIATYYEGKFKEYEITHVLTGINSKLNLLISRDENYRLLYSDKNFVIYEIVDIYN